MAIARKPNFLSSPAKVPNRVADLINNFASKIDENILNIFKGIAADIDDFRISVYGILRRFDGMLFIYNYPSQLETDVKEAMRMDKYGNFSFGNEYPRWPFCKVDVGGPLYAVPQFGLWSKSTVDAAGPGSYAWDVEVYNPYTDIYQRVPGNAAIQINMPGTYDVRVNVFGQDVVAASADNVTFALVHNGVTIIRANPLLSNQDLVWCHMTKIINVAKGDAIRVDLIAPGTTAKFGNAFPQTTWLEICKVN